MKAKLSLTVIIVAAFLLPGCRGGTPPNVSGRWRVDRIEWTQNEKRVQLTADGVMTMGRFKLPTRPASFEPMIQAMQHVTIEVSQAGGEISGRVHADPEVPQALLDEAGARAGSAIAEFEGSLVNDTIGSVLVTTPDGQRREVLIHIQDRGRRIVAKAVPVFGESDEQASDIVLVPLEGGR